MLLSPQEDLALEEALEAARGDDPLLVDLGRALQASMHDMGRHVHPDDAAKEAARIVANDARDRGNTSEADRFRLPPSASPSTSPSRADLETERLIAAMLQDEVPARAPVLTGANAKKRTPPLQRGAPSPLSEINKRMREAACSGNMYDMLDNEDVAATAATATATATFESMEIDISPNVASPPPPDFAVNASSSPETAASRSNSPAAANAPPGSAKSSSDSSAAANAPPGSAESSSDRSAAANAPPGRTAGASDSRTTATEAASPIRESMPRRGTRVGRCDSAADVRSMQRAFLTQLEDDGTTSCVATGEYRADEGVFAVEFVSPEHHDIDLAGVQLGAMVGEVVVLDDIEDADLELDWDEYWDDDWGALHEETLAARHGTSGNIEVTVATAEPPLPVQMSDAASQTEYEPTLFRYPFEPSSVRVRGFNEKPGKLGKLVSLGEFLQTCKKARMVQPPILTPSERVREGQEP